MEENKVRQRAKSKKLRVTFPDGRVICYPRAVDTFVAVLREIGSQQFPEITLEMSHLPLLSREIYPEFKNWMKPVCDGWYVNNQSSNDQKYMQLRSIGKSLDLGLTVELGEDFEPQQNPGKERTRKSKSKLSVRLGEADEWLCGANMQETFIMVIKEIGIDEVMKRNIGSGGRDLITRYRQSAAQVEIADNRWLNVPGTTRDKLKLLKVIASHLRLKIEAKLE